MTKEEKNLAIGELAEKLSDVGVLYLADTSSMDADSTSKLRRSCFKSGVELSIVKNTLLKKAMDQVEGKDFSELYDVLAGPTAIMISETGNIPAKVIADFRKKGDRPILKAAFVDEAVFIGDDQLKMLSEIKSKEELLGEIIGLLQSPAKNVVSALQSGKNTLAGLVKTLADK